MTKGLGEGPDEGEELSSERFFTQPSRPPKRRIGTLVPIVCMAACAFLLARSTDDLAYLFQPGIPVDLGQAGDYHLESARPGAYARIRGEVRSEGARFQRLLTNGKVWPLLGAPVLIERRSFDELRGKVEATGLLRIDDQLPSQYHPVIATFLNLHQLAPPGPGGHVWVIDEGRAPRGIDRANGWLLLLLVLFGLNAWWVLAPIVRR